MSNAKYIYFLPSSLLLKGPSAPRSIRDIKQIYRRGYGYPLDTLLTSRGLENTGPSPCHNRVTDSVEKRVNYGIGAERKKQGNGLKLKTNKVE
jgi:hypothetical protein